MAPDEAHQERLRLSSAMGIVAAQQLLRDDDDARHKEHQQQGRSVKGRVGRMLGFASDVVASPGPSGKSGSDDTGLISLSGGGDLAPGASSSSSSSIFGSLEFVPSSMHAGGHVLVATEKRPAKQAIRGKPSSALLLRNLASRGAVDAQLQADLLSECSRYGVVRGLVVYELPDSHPLSSNDKEGLRVFVRYDTVAAAFKAAEMLNGRSFDGRRVVVSFYPAALFDNSQLAEDQPLAE
jgi:hypothetical protein